MCDVLTAKNTIDCVFATLQVEGNLSLSERGPTRAFFSRIQRICVPPLTTSSQNPLPSTFFLCPSCATKFCGTGSPSQAKNVGLFLRNLRKFKEKETHARRGRGLFEGRLGRMWNFVRHSGAAGARVEAESASKKTMPSTLQKRLKTYYFLPQTNRTCRIQNRTAANCRTVRSPRSCAKTNALTVQDFSALSLLPWQIQTEKNVSAITSSQC